MIAQQYDADNQKFIRLLKVFQEVSYKDWNLYLYIKENDIPYIQWRFLAPDYSVTGSKKLTHMETREWRVDYSWSDTKLIRTAFKAIRNAELHEAEEAFRFKDAPVYSPHISVSALVDITSHSENFEIE